MGESSFERFASLEPNLLQLRPEIDGCPSRASFLAGANGGTVRNLFGRETYTRYLITGHDFTQNRPKSYTIPNPSAFAYYAATEWQLGERENNISTSQKTICYADHV